MYSNSLFSLRIYHYEFHIIEVYLVFLNVNIEKNRQLTVEV